MTRPNSWMPIYWGDYSKDTGHLNNSGHGAYLMLIKHYWCSGKPLPNDDGQLWRIACCNSRKAWLRIKPVLEPLFVASQNYWNHSRVDKEIAKAIEISQKRSAIAKQMHSKSTAIAVQVHTQPQSHTKKDIEGMINGLVDKKNLNGAARKADYTDKAVVKQRWQQKVVAYANRVCRPHDLRMWLAVALTDTQEGKLAFERMNDRMRADEAAAGKRA